MMGLIYGGKEMINLLKNKIFILFVLIVALRFLGIHPVFPITILVVFLVVRLLNLDAYLVLKLKILKANIRFFYLREYNKQLLGLIRLIEKIKSRK